MNHNTTKQKIYKQLRYKERIKIETLFGLDFNITEIANELGRSKATISKEIKRNSRKNSKGKNLGYDAKLAQQKKHKRKKRACKKDRLKNQKKP